VAVPKAWTNDPRKVNFFTRQYIDALSPSNFALTNPEVFRETVKSHGQNLIKGLNNLLRDVAMTASAHPHDRHLGLRAGQERRHHAGQGRSRTTDAADPVQPATPDVQAPLLIVPPWINKYYILDLREKNSMVKWATDQGTPPSSSPGQPGREAGRRASTPICSKAPRPSTHLEPDRRRFRQPGYCLGGTLTIRRWLTWPPRRTSVVSATFFTTMLDFSEPGELSVFSTKASTASRRRWPSAASKARKWPAPSTCCAPTT
jgi:polyhydroxyalkanoate synthase